MFFSKFKEIIYQWSKGRWWSFRLFFLFFLVYIALKYADDPNYPSILGGINLIIHEAGHIFLSWAPVTVMLMGGTLFQIVIPIASIFMFLTQPDLFACSFSGVWLASNLYNISIYIADARAQALPLVTYSAGDPIHDWNYLLFKFGILQHDLLISAGVKILAFVVMWLSILYGIWIIWIMVLSNRDCPNKSSLT